MAAPPDRPRGNGARAAAAALLEAVLVRRRLLDEAFGADAGVAALDGRDRAFARLLAATTLRRLGQIDALLGRCLERPPPAKAGAVMQALRLGACQLLFLDTPPHAAIATSVALVKGGPLAGFAGLVNAVLRRLDREGRGWPAEQDAAVLNTPEWMWRSWTAAYGEDGARAIAAAHLGEPPVDVTTSGDAAAWAGPLEATLLPTGSLRRTGHGDITGLPGFAEGAWWVQDAGAALPARLLGAVAGRRVADLCAAPGGKTMQLAAAGAHVTAVDRSAKRLELVRANLARIHFEAEIVTADAAAWTPPQPFDAVLLDAPCSATGTLRRHPDGLRLKSPADVAALAATQGRLLRAAAAMTAPGGTLIYCVCSLEPEEGAAIVDAFLAEQPAFSRRPIAAGEAGIDAGMITGTGDLRTLPCHWPEQGGIDGFHAARLVRAGGT
jgi:16S rRNA (cytosine967-C5)-methyltransferase